MLPFKRCRIRCRVLVPIRLFGVRLISIKLITSWLPRWYIPAGYLLFTRSGLFLFWHLLWNNTHLIINGWFDTMTSGLGISVPFKETISITIRSSTIILLIIYIVIESIIIGSILLSGIGLSIYSTHFFNHI